MDGQKTINLSKKKLVKFYSLIQLFSSKYKKVTVEVVNKESGAYLHQFKWCKDEEIGSLDERWNWLKS